MRELLVVGGAICDAVLATGCGRLSIVGRPDEEVTVDAPEPIPDVPEPGTDAPCGAACSYPDTILADRPLAYWRFDDAAAIAADTSGNDRRGAYSGGIERITGLFDGSFAAEFDGASGHIPVGDGFDFSGDAPFSIEAWIRPMVVDVTSRYVFTWLHRAEPQQGVALSVYRPAAGPRAQTVRFGRIVNGESFGVEFARELTTQFTHVVATYDGSTMRLFVQGTGTEQLVDARQMPPVSVVARIGNATPSDNNWFDGAIDEVAIYDVALTDARIQAHFVAATAN